ncbi:hypothetical protein [Leuconostoc mesenteroides]|uniref:hypothetical protein n=1 Tax=Leuconostoc mesenteroides TaxID=1245 RepID=UPI000775E2EF|nr:hypothetical protein [Leuconostoc mesenteroides]
MTESLHKFKTIQSIADELNIKRQTLYNRSKKTGVDISKKEFSDEEWASLIHNEKLTNVNGDNDIKLSEIDILKQRIDEQSGFIETLRKEIEAKNIQIDQAQKLQLMAEQRFNDTNNQLLEYKEKEGIHKKSIWKRLFMYD